MGNLCKNLVGISIDSHLQDATKLPMGHKKVPVNKTEMYFIIVNSAGKCHHLITWKKEAQHTALVPP